MFLKFLISRENVFCGVEVEVVSRRLIARLSARMCKTILGVRVQKRHHNYLA